MYLLQHNQLKTNALQHLIQLQIHPVFFFIIILNPPPMLINQHISIDINKAVINFPVYITCSFVSLQQVFSILFCRVL